MSLPSRRRIVAVSLEEGVRTPLTSRTDAVNLPVTDSGSTAATSPPGDAAGALEAERVAVDGVAADPPVLDAEPKPSYRDGVEHERIRQSRLSLWQAQR
jgi:hypothetical protein